MHPDSHCLPLQTATIIADAGKMCGTVCHRGAATWRIAARYSAACSTVWRVQWSRRCVQYSLPQRGSGMEHCCPLFSYLLHCVACSVEQRLQCSTVCHRGAAAWSIAARYSAGCSTVWRVQWSRGCSAELPSLP
jgi:hypothetical protein